MKYNNSHDLFGFGHHRNTSRMVLEAIGLRPGHRLPNEGTSPVKVGGLWVKVVPKGQGIGKGRRAHRTLAECPLCNRWYCAGHIGQHYMACGSGQ